MKKIIAKLWKDDGGALIAVEWVFVATILVLGVIVGLVAVRNAVNSELAEFANAVTSLCQNYSFNGTALQCGSGKNAASTCGSSASGDVGENVSLMSVHPNANNIEVGPCPHGCD